MTKRRVLVIRLGALGDFILSAGPFAAIRAHHPDDEIVLLTTRPFAAFAAASPWFDTVWIDERPRLWQPGKVLSLLRRLRAGGFDRVYDLQTSDRSSWYFRLMGGRVVWSGIAPGCALPHANPDRDRMHTLDRQAEQLAMAGLAPAAADFTWVRADTARFGLPAAIGLLCPGAAPHRPAKRWPVAGYAAAARHLLDRGITPVLVGRAPEAADNSAIRAACPGAVDLTGRTDLADLAVLARGARIALGNDTGPMHLFAACGCPSLVLFSADSDPALCAPRGRVRILSRPDLGTLDPAPVLAALDDLTG
jgi:ADP-heptose:LPS heptosyltransferase